LALGVKFEVVPNDICEAMLVALSPDSEIELTKSCSMGVLQQVSNQNLSRCALPQVHIETCLIPNELLLELKAEMIGNRLTF